MKTVFTGYYGLDDLDGKDDRSSDWEKERKERGFDETELWSLGDTIAKFCIPRIKRMREIEIELHKPEDIDIESYDAIIEGLELFIRNDGDRTFSKMEQEKVAKALELFGPMLPHMWF